MSKLIYQNSIDDSVGEFQMPLEIPAQRKVANSISSASESFQESFDYLNKKHHDGSFSRQESAGSRSSYSLIPNLKRSFDGFPGFNISQHYAPRPKKTLRLFDVTINSLKDLYQKYSDSTYLSNTVEVSEGLAMYTRADNRILLLQALKVDYEVRMEEREALLKEIKESVANALSIDFGRKDVDMIDYEDLCTVNREMCVIESKLERCCGKLQFQVIELDSVSRVNPFDQYELTIRLSDSAKFKSRIKVEKNGHQIWDSTNFTMSPTIDDAIYIKFVELKTLNKSSVLIDKKVSLVNDLILPESSIFTFWVTAVGTIKLRTIVQWNALLDDNDLNGALTQIDVTALKDSGLVRKRENSELLKSLNNRYSISVSSMLRLDSFDNSFRKTAIHGSMGDIAENTFEDVNIRSVPIARNRDKARAEYGSDICKEINMEEGHSIVDAVIESGIDGELENSVTSGSSSRYLCHTRGDCTDTSVTVPQIGEALLVSTLAHIEDDGPRINDGDEYVLSECHVIPLSSQDELVCDDNIGGDQADTCAEGDMGQGNDSATSSVLLCDNTSTRISLLPSCHDTHTMSTDVIHEEVSDIPINATISISDQGQLMTPINHVTSDHQGSLQIDNYIDPTTQHQF